MDRARGLDSQTYASGFHGPVTGSGGLEFALSVGHRVGVCGSHVVRVIGVRVSFQTEGEFLIVTIICVETTFIQKKEKSWMDLSTDRAFRYEVFTPSDVMFQTTGDRVRSCCCMDSRLILVLVQ